MANRVSDNIVNDYLTCSICCGRYSDPKKLPCDHSFCAKCLKDYVARCSSVLGQSSVPCPICRAELHFPPSDSDGNQLVDQLPKDTLLISFLHVINVHEESDEIATEKSKKIAEEELQKQTCALHKNQLLDVYCHEHRVVVCSQCAMQNHRTKTCKCWSTSDARRIYQSKIGTLKSLMEQQISAADAMIKPEAVAQHLLEESKRNSMRSIDNLQDQIEEHCNSISFEIKHFKKDIKEACDISETKLSTFGTLTENLKRTQDMFLETCEKNIPFEVLQVLPQVEEKVADFQRKLDEKRREPHSSFRVELSINEKLKHLLSTEMQFGSFRIIEERQTLDAGATGGSPTPVLNAHAHTQCTPGWVLVEKPAAREHCCFSAMLPGEQICSLSGVVCMGDSIIIADQNNNKIKRYVMWSGVFVDDLELEEPHQISLIPCTFDVAITQWENKITILSTDGKLKVKETIITEKNYVGICALNEEKLAVSCYHNKSVDIIDRRGKILKTIKYFTQTIIPSLFFKKSLFLTPTVITQTSNGNIVVCDSKRHRIICVDEDGSVVWSHNTVTRPSGIGSFDRQIVVTFQKNDTVAKMSETGVSQGTVMGPCDGLAHPWAISIWRNYMVVTEDCPSGKVHISTWKDDE